MEKNHCSLTIVVPALNEERNIEEMLSELAREVPKYVDTWEVIVVNDGSRDKTGLIADKYSKDNSNIRVLHNPSPIGFGGATIRGFREATGDVAVMLPGDNEVAASDVLRYLPLASQVDLVIPFPVNSQLRPVTRRLISWLYTRIVNITFGTSFNYTNGTILYRREALNNVVFRTTGFFFQTEAIIQLVRMGYYYAEVPFTLRHRKHGTSKAVSLKAFYGVVKAFLLLWSELFIKKSIPEAKGGTPPADSVRGKTS